MKKLLPHKGWALLLAVFYSTISFTQHINIRAWVNEEEADTVFQDEPVIFDISVTNQKAQSDERWNQAADRSLRQLEEKRKAGTISQEQFDKEKFSIESQKRKIYSVTLGTTSSSWVSTVSWKITNTANRNAENWPLQLMLKPPTNGTAVLDGDGYYNASWGIRPEDMNRIKPGVYAIEFLINNIPSNALLLKMEAGNMPPVMAGSAPILLRFGQFYWQSGDGERTIQYAERILAESPNSLDGLTLKGDGQVLQRSYLPALETYNKALKEYYRLHGAGAEPPEYLLTMVGWLKKELGEPER